MVQVCYCKLGSCTNAWAVILACPPESAWVEEEITGWTDIQLQGCSTTLGPALYQEVMVNKLSYKKKLESIKHRGRPPKVY